MKTSQTAFLLALVTVGSVAQAQTTFSNINATYGMNPGSGSISWLVSQNVPPMTIDFTQNAPAFKVGDTTGFTDGTSTITYDVTSSVAITGVSLVLQGNVQNFGEIQWSQSASTGSGTLGSISGSIVGSSLPGGANGAFTQVFQLNFNQAVTSFSISQTLAIDINGQSLPSTSVALVGLVENNFQPVPEPASMAALGLGAVAMLRRRRRKNA